jgi:integrase
MRNYELRSFASALVLQGVPAENLTTLAASLSLENYKLGLQWFYVRHGSKPGRMVHNLAANLKAIARHWLKVDKDTLEAMSKIVSRLAPPTQGMSDKNRDRLRPFDYEDNIKAIVNLPQTIRRHLGRASSAKARKTGLSTAAMAAELLLVAPMRLGNLCQLHLDQHFINVGDKTHLVFRKEDVKNTVDLEYELPAETLELLDWYISHHRKADPQNRYVFAGEGLSHKSTNTLRQQIMQTVKAYTGLTVNPHLFRAIGGSIYLQAYPGAYEVVRQVLGHRNIATTTAFYTGQEDRRSRRHFIETVQKLRDQPAAKPGHKGEKP